jgi:hypothetical protein
LGEGKGKGNSGRREGKGREGIMVGIWCKRGALFLLSLLVRSGLVFVSPEREEKRRETDARWMPGVQYMGERYDTTFFLAE